jgi:hypothetical protein
MIPTINVGSLDAKDRQAAVWMIDNENARRTAAAAAEVPPGTPVLLPKGTGAEIKNSYETILVPILVSAHESYKQQEAQANGPDRAEFKTAFANATPQQRTAALAALTS